MLAHLRGHATPSLATVWILYGRIMRCCYVQGMLCQSIRATGTCPIGANPSGWRAFHTQSGRILQLLFLSLAEAVSGCPLPIEHQSEDAT